jgi:hypothetical protein
MTTSPATPSPAQPSLGTRLRRLAAIVLVFIVVGPPIGMIVFVLSMIFIAAGMKFNPWVLAGFGLLAKDYAVPVYLSNLKSAAAIGLLVGIRQAFFGAITWPFAVGGGIAIGLGFVLLSSLSIPPRSDNYVVLTGYATTVAKYLCTTFVCWAIVRNWYFERARADRVPA